MPFISGNYFQYDMIDKCFRFSTKYYTIDSKSRKVNYRADVSGVDRLAGQQELFDENKHRDAGIGCHHRVDAL